MPEINLLKQKSVSEDFWNYFPGVLLKILIVVLLGFFGYYGWLFVQHKKVNKQILVTSNDIIQKKASLDSFIERDELLTRQLQIKEYKNLLSKHFYWSQIFPILSKSTLSTAKYYSFIAGLDNTISLTVNVPSIKDLDKFLLVFDRPEIYKNFHTVSIGGIRQLKSSTGLVSSIETEVKMKYDSSLLPYKDLK